MERQSNNQRRKAKASLSSGSIMDNAKEAANSFVYRKTYFLPEKLKISFHLDAGNRQVICKWFPDVPTGKTMSKVWPAYITARDDFFIGLGVSIAVLDL
jgi:hypothetical protein